MAPFYGWGSTVSRLEPLRGGNDVVQFCVTVLVASEVCSFDDGDGGGGNEVDGNEDECNEDGFVVLSLC